MSGNAFHPRGSWAIVRKGGSKSSSFRFHGDPCLRKGSSIIGGCCYFHGRSAGVDRPLPHALPTVSPSTTGKKPYSSRASDDPPKIFAGGNPREVRFARRFRRNLPDPDAPEVLARRDKEHTRSMDSQKGSNTSFANKSMWRPGSHRVRDHTQGFALDQGGLTAGLGPQPTKITGMEKRECFRRGFVKAGSFPGIDQVPLTGTPERTPLGGGVLQCVRSRPR